ncbi:hypothetical protein [Cupriavidus sp. D384]|uniref:hypothetical protein n=1 Tax=Cupriavidus sp. D384 TaxID=1538095 RepID=UPI001E3204E4|nr:hypothetical protein [Cupriavidus sp. D384]
MLTDISSIQAARRHDGRRGPIEYSRARHAPEIRLYAGFAASARISRCREDTALRDTGRGGIPATEFISVRFKLSCADESLARLGHVSMRLGSVGSSI